jgi:hypothetical protein
LYANNFLLILYGQSSQSVKYDNDFVDQVELEHLHFSPRSTTWEPSLSAETCSSAGSWTNANGEYTCSYLFVVIALPEDLSHTFFYNFLSLVQNQGFLVQRKEQHHLVQRRTVDP